MSIISVLSKLSGWFRLLIVSSVIWIIGALVATDPWTRRGRRSGSYSNWDDFFLVGILPVVVLWGIIWIVQGFKKGSKKDEHTHFSQDDSDKFFEHRESSTVPHDFSSDKHTITDPSGMDNGRILCADESCIGTLNPDGVCTECGRTLEEINEGIRSKTQQSSFSKTIPKSLLNRMRITLWVCIIIFLLFIVAANVLDTGTVENELIKILIIIGSAVLIIGNILFLRDVGLLAILLNKSPIMWIAGCLFIPFFFHIYAYVHLSGLAFSKFMVSDHTHSR
jgi:hypothetical protein